MAERYPRPWSWPGAIAMVLASCLGAGWLLGVIAAALGALGESVPEPGVVQLLNGIGQVLAGALGTYLGFAAGSSRPRPTSPAQPGTAPPAVE